MKAAQGEPLPIRSQDPRSKACRSVWSVKSVEKNPAHKCAADAASLFDTVDMAGSNMDLWAARDMKVDRSISKRENAENFAPSDLHSRIDCPYNFGWAARMISI
jgi:hypothetical protein